MNGEALTTYTVLAGGGYIFPSIAGSEKRGLENFIFNNAWAAGGIYACDGNSGRCAMGGQPYLEGVGNFLGFDGYDSGIPFNAGEEIAIKYIPIPQTLSDVYHFDNIDAARHDFIAEIIGSLDDGTRVFVEQKKRVQMPYEFWSYRVPTGKKLTVKNLILGVTEEWGIGEAELGTILFLIDHKPYRGLALRAMRGDQVYGASGTVPMAIGACSTNHFTFARNTELGEDLVLYEGQVISFAWYYPLIAIANIKNLENVLYKTNYLKGVIIGELEDLSTGTGTGFTAGHILIDAESGEPYVYLQDPLIVGTT
jgi:hypothetical protein